MYYILRDSPSMSWKDKHNSLFLYEDTNFIKFYKRIYPDEKKPPNLPEAVEPLYNEHIIRKADTLKEIEYEALMLMLTI